jgi:hypothetical protein
MKHHPKNESLLEIKALDQLEQGVNKNSVLSGKVMAQITDLGEVPAYFFWLI